MSAVNKILLRPLRLDDEAFLWEMLYQALYVPPGSPPLPREVLAQPEISRYVAGWGRAGDSGLVAFEEASQRSVGAAWIRLLTGAERGYGYVDEATPELSIALLPEYRGQGIGTRLMARLLEDARAAYPALSLSVSADNPARSLYQRLGFAVATAAGTSLTMVKSFNATR